MSEATINVMKRTELKYRLSKEQVAYFEKAILEHMEVDAYGLTSKRKQKGTISIQGGSVYVDSLHDALDAAYNVEIDQLDDTAPTSISLKTGTDATYYS